jgi:hypothetical protein
MMNTMMKTMMILTDMIEAKVVIHQILNWQLPKELISLITQREGIETIYQTETGRRVQRPIKRKILGMSS